MKIIKEVCIGDDFKRCVIRTDTYAKSVEHIMYLYRIASKDFPHLMQEDFSIAHYGGRRYKGTYGIEFNVNMSSNTEDYRQIKNMEVLL